MYMELSVYVTNPTRYCWVQVSYKFCLTCGIELWLHLKFTLAKSLISQLVSIIKNVLWRTRRQGQTCRSCLAGGASDMGRDSRLPSTILPLSCAGAAAGAGDGECVGGAASLTSKRRNSDMHGHGTTLKNKDLSALILF